MIKLPNFYPVGPPIVFPFRYTSYAEQHRDEVMKIFEVIETRKMEVPILMGDYNHGPASPSKFMHDYIVAVTKVLVV